MNNLEMINNCKPLLKNFSYSPKYNKIKCHSHDWYVICKYKYVKKVFLRYDIKHTITRISTIFCYIL